MVLCFHLSPRPPKCLDIMANRAKRHANNTEVTIMPAHDLLNENLAASTISTEEEINLPDKAAIISVTTTTAVQPIPASSTAPLQDQVPVSIFSVPQSTPEGASALFTEPLGALTIEKITNVVTIDDPLRDYYAILVKDFSRNFPNNSAKKIHNIQDMSCISINVLGKICL